MLVRSAVAGVLGVAAVVAGVTFSAGPPRLLMVNAGLRLSHPWVHPAGLALATLGALVVAVALRPRWARALACAVALLTLAATWSLLRFRLDVDAAGLHLRDWTSFRERTVPWSAVSQVESGPAALVVRAGDQGFRVDVHDVRPADRAALDRAIARRIGSAASTPPY
jgi:hypothetical protein